ncbi:YolD-like family protein [Bacillus sp. NPDC094106]|uniref:YolD-like family protein n=1 Tax=Bacillus sp. NPDC094106 TaxID=3363949 RepID=UPI00381E579C
MSNAKMPKEKEMVTWTPFAGIPERFISIRKILEEQMKVPRPILTQDAKDRIEDKLLTSLLSEEEILITYYEDGYVLTNYITVIHINPMKQTVTCTDAFYHISTLKFIDIIDIK